MRRHYIHDTFLEAGSLDFIILSVGQSPVLSTMVLPEKEAKVALWKSGRVQACIPVRIGSL